MSCSTVSHRACSDCTTHVFTNASCASGVDSHGEATLRTREGNHFTLLIGMRPGNPSVLGELWQSTATLCASSFDGTEGICMHMANHPARLTSTQTCRPDNQGWVPANRRLGSQLLCALACGGVDGVVLVAHRRPQGRLHGDCTGPCCEQDRSA